MVQKFSEIMDNYNDMSVAELGTSLLTRKEEQVRRQEKKDKKSERVQQALGLLLAGQGIFKSAYKRRVKELDDLYKLNTQDNDYQTKQINQYGNVVSPLFTFEKQYLKKNPNVSLNTEEEITKFKESFLDSDFFNTFRFRVNAGHEKVYEELYGLQGINPEDAKNSANDNTLKTIVASNILDEYLKLDPVTKQSNYKNGIDELKRLFKEENLEGVALFQKARNLTLTQLNEIENNEFRRLANEARDKGNIFNVLSSFLNFTGDKTAKESGGINIFRTVDEKVFQNPSLNKVLSEVDFGSIASQFIDKAFVESLKTGDSLELVYQSKANEKNRIQDDILISNFAERAKIKDVRILKFIQDRDDDKDAKILGTTELQYLFKDMLEPEKNRLMLDAGTLAVGLDPKNSQYEKFQKGVFEDTYQKDGNMTFNQFKNFMSVYANRYQYALVIAASEGFTENPQKIGFFPRAFARREGYNPQDDVPTVIYDRYKGIIPSLLGQGLVRPTNNKESYKIDEHWEQLSLNGKKDMYAAEILNIKNNDKLNEKQKELRLADLDRNVPSPYNMSVEEFILSDEFEKYLQTVGRATIIDDKPIDFTETRPSPRGQTVRTATKYMDVANRINLESLSNEQLRYLQQSNDAQLLQDLNITGARLRPASSLILENPLVSRASNILAERIRRGEAPVIADITSSKPTEFFVKLRNQL